MCKTISNKKRQEAQIIRSSVAVQRLRLTSLTPVHDTVTMELQSSSMAKSESLLKWVNSFDGVTCESFQDLSSGQTFLECLHKIMPGVITPCTNDPWKEIFSIFEEFCGCTLEKAVSAEEIASGNQEHISRVVVLLLSVAVQSKNNEAIINAITSLDYDAQRDIMYFIESTLAKVKSHAIMAGTFTSGVGEALPSLDTSVSPTPSNQTSSPERPGSPDVVRESSREELYFRTPSKPSRAVLQTASFYNGLDSSAGVKLLMSPAITGRVGRMKSYISTDTQTPESVSASSSKEEISKLKHSIRVLEGTLQVEKKLAQEYYTELCSKIQECEELKNSHSQLERKLECLHEMSDVQDELAHMTLSLAAAEKSIAGYRNRIEVLEGYKEKAAEMEAMMRTYETKAAQCEEYHKNMERLEKLVMEKASAVKHLELQFNKATIEAETKSTHLDSLLRENREQKRELDEFKGRCRQLREDANQMELTLSGKNDSEAALLLEKQELQIEFEKLQASVGSSKKEISELKVRQLEDRTSMATCTMVKSELQVELSAKVSELASKDVEIQALQTTRDDLETQVTQLKSSLKSLEANAASREADLQQELSDKGTVLAHKELTIKALETSKRELEIRTAELEGTISTLEEEKVTREARLMTTKIQFKALETNNAALEGQVRALKQDIAAKYSELKSKDLLFGSLEDAKAELEYRLSQVQQQNLQLEQDIARRETEMGALESARKDLERDALQSQLDMKKTAEQATSALRAELTAANTQIISLNTSKKDLEAQLADIWSLKTKLEEDVSVKTAELATSNAKISRLAVTKDNLKTDLEAAQRDLSTVKAQGSLFETETSNKNSLLDTYKKKCFELEARETRHTEKMANQQSSLQSSQNLNVSLTKQVTDLESRCFLLEAELKSKDKITASKDKQISEYKSELDTNRQLLKEQREHRPAVLESDSMQVQNLIRENLLLQSQQKKLWQDYDKVSEKERIATLQCQELEADLAMEKARFQNFMSSVEVGSADMPVSTQSPLMCDLESVGEFTVDSDIQHLDTRSKVTEDTAPTEPVIGWSRMKELTRRNKQAPPHLKSSYPIEMQVKPETPSSSDDNLKYGGMRQLSRGSTLTLEQLDCSSWAPFTPPADMAGSSSTGTVTLARGVSDHQPHGAPNPRRLSAPPTPEPYSGSGFKRQQLTTHGKTLCPTLNLREFLDNPSTTSVDRQRSSTAFDVAFSPPKAKGGPPKRLQENKSRSRNKGVKDAAEGNDIRRDTVCKRKGDDSSSSRSRGKGPKKTLRPKN